MDTALKTLVAVTCFVLIAAAGYWFWNDQQAKSAMAEAAQFAADATACTQLLDDMKANKTKGRTVGEVAFCIAKGHLSKNDLTKSGFTELADEITPGMIASVSKP